MFNWSEKDFYDFNELSYFLYFVRTSMTNLIEPYMDNWGLQSDLSMISDIFYEFGEKKSQFEIRLFLFFLVPSRFILERSSYIRISFSSKIILFWILIRSQSQIYLIFFSSTSFILNYFWILDVFKFSKNRYIYSIRITCLNALMFFVIYLWSFSLMWSYRISDNWWNEWSLMSFLSSFIRQVNDNRNMSFQS